jgi:hypothetical protein
MTRPRQGREAQARASAGTLLPAVRPRQPVAQGQPEQPPRDAAGQAERPLPAGTCLQGVQRQREATARVARAAQVGWAWRAPRQEMAERRVRVLLPAPAE